MRPEVLTAKEVSDLFAAKSGSAPGTARDRAMLSLMYRADLKIHQIALLERRDYEPETGNLDVPGTQGGSARTVQLDSRSRELLDEWIAVRRGLGYALWPGSFVR